MTIQLPGSDYGHSICSAIVDKKNSPGENRPMIIDAHNHVNWLGFAPEKIIENMDRNHIDRTWLLSWEAPESEIDPAMYTPNFSPGRRNCPSRMFARPQPVSRIASLPDIARIRGTPAPWTD